MRARIFATIAHYRDLFSTNSSMVCREAVSERGLCREDQCGRLCRANRVGMSGRTLAGSGVCREKAAEREGAEDILARMNFAACWEDAIIAAVPPVVPEVSAASAAGR